jgi:hypothetical protein
MPKTKCWRLERECNTHGQRDKTSEQALVLKCDSCMFCLYQRPGATGALHVSLRGRPNAGNRIHGRISVNPLYCKVCGHRTVLSGLCGGLTPGMLAYHHHHQS